MVYFLVEQEEQVRKEITNLKLFDIIIFKAGGLFNTGQRGTGLFGDGGLGGRMTREGLLNPTSQQSGLFGGNALRGMGTLRTLFGGQTSLGGTSGGLGGMSAGGLGAQGQVIYYMFFVQYYS